MTLQFVIILQNLIKAYHRKSGESKYDCKLTELDVETTWRILLMNDHADIQHVLLRLQFVLPRKQYTRQA